MAVTYLPPKPVPDHCDVTVGVMADGLEIVRIAESFRGLVEVLPASEPSCVGGCEVEFRQSANRQQVEIELPAVEERLPEHRILVSVAASPFPAIDSVAHAVLAPAFARGVVGIDWEDVCAFLRLGKRAVLVMAESAEAVSETLRLAESELAAGERNQISGLMPAMFSPYRAKWKEAILQLRGGAKTLAPDASWLVAIPIVLGDNRVCSLLAVLSE